ncbi:MAG: FAD-dependent oxidoreductase [Gemmatimonadales bacterium]|nr:FAD-dependent oxidoreductase [Gemmatimonadales bacterium]
MQRDLDRLAGMEHDVVVVGGGIHGACIAWDAALRGLRVALIERDDFGGATSANSLRIVHGGLRYLARGALRRMRESIQERSAFLRIAPSLVEPLPVLIPTRGAGTQSRPAMAAALALNDQLSLGRNRGLGPDHRLPRGRLLSIQECERLFPAFPSEGTSGGALWHDARVRHPERLILAFVRGAVSRGAAAANYVRMERVTHEGGAVRGVAATDLLGGGPVEVRGRAVVIAAGPWTGQLVGGERSGHPQAFALNLVVGRRLAEAAVGLRVANGADEDPIIGGGRFVFLVPQDDRTFLGTWYARADGQDTGGLIQRGSVALLDEFRSACGAAALDEADVIGCQWGWLPLKSGRERGREDALAERPCVMGHGASDGIGGMFSVEGVKYTGARRVAEDVVDRVVSALGIAVDRCRTAHTPVDEDDVGAASASLHARVRHAVRDEMAVRLSDVVLRRIGSGLPPAAEAVAAAARITGAELGWTPPREQAEIEAVMSQIRTTSSVVELPA